MNCRILPSLIWQEGGLFWITLSISPILWRLASASIAARGLAIYALTIGFSVWGSWNIDCKSSIPWHSIIVVCTVHTRTTWKHKSQIENITSTIKAPTLWWCTLSILEASIDHLSWSNLAHFHGWTVIVIMINLNVVFGFFFLLRIAFGMKGKRTDRQPLGWADRQTIRQTKRRIG